MPGKSVSKLIICRDASHLAATAANEFVRLANESVGRAGKFSVALSGGSTPRVAFSLLAASPLVEQVPWNSIHLFWSDERMVPPDDKDSNFRMANEAMISRVAIPAANVHRMRGELDPETAADEYAKELESFFGDGLPRFDLIMLGMGDDGHTASLFPGTEALSETTRSVLSNYVAKLSTHRLTFSSATINNAANVIFLISGPAKVPALKEVIEGELNTSLYPSQLIHPKDGTLEYLVDRAAAAGLEAARSALAQPEAEAPVEIELS